MQDPGNQEATSALHLRFLLSENRFGPRVLAKGHDFPLGPCAPPMGARVWDAEHRDVPYKFLLAFPLLPFNTLSSPSFSFLSPFVTGRLPAALWSRLTPSPVVVRAPPAWPFARACGHPGRGSCLILKSRQSLWLLLPTLIRATMSPCGLELRGAPRPARTWPP